MAASVSRIIVMRLTLLLTAPVSVLALPKILCLHGGGQSGSSFESQQSMVALRTQLSSQFELVYAQAPESGSVWVRDAPGGKSAGTADASWAQTSVDYLDGFVASNGPFAGILGYSQGSAFATYYVSQRQTAASVPFQFAMLFCGYIPTVHAGLASAIDAAAPFHNIPALVFMGARDFVIANAMTTAQAGKYTNPTVITSPSEGHDLPAAGSGELAQAVTWAGDYASGGGATSAAAGTSYSTTTLAEESSSAALVNAGAGKIAGAALLVVVGDYFAMTL
mmetsp:Transcript_16089/g.41608  ORF Transcript_16089/g.41608 Transcript_16089/m.41608 type:complete len:279 (+) Transcript_16089:61-897(+)